MISSGPARFFLLVALGAFPAFGTITYTCDSSISTATCNYLNVTVAGYYNSAFKNANATIYIEMGSTGLGESTSGYQNPVTYSAYVAALTANPTKNVVDTDALAALSANDASVYGTGDVNLTSALAGALGITSGVDGSIAGMEVSSGTVGSACANPGDGAVLSAANSSSCYNGLVIISNTANLYYDNLGGAEPSNAFDFYAVVQHETDEVLGTASCMSTTSSALADPCQFTDEPSAIDLYRYNSAGHLASMSSCVGTNGNVTACPTGAYFSYNGGATNGADGFVFNTEPNEDDYADFVFNSCGGAISIQNGVDCGGSATPQDKGLTILNDGGAEVNMLNAVGFDAANPSPEPATLGLLGMSLVGLALTRRRRNQ